jgi:membrane protease YdiL (CAAX protease family)
VRPVTAQQHGIVLSITLHLLPGALGTLAFVWLAPPLVGRGLPSLLAMLAAALFVIVPVELGILLYAGYKRNQQLRLDGIVLYREPVPWWQYVAIVLPLLFWAFVVTGLMQPFDTTVGNSLFGWLPDWYFIFGDSASGQVAPSVLLWTLVLGLVVNGIILPVVEELYFRGYLLPRIDRLGAWAPFANGLLFSLYHFWTPWQNVSRLLFVWPMVYATWWKRNVWIAIMTHVAVNIVGGLLMIGLVLNQAGS